MENKTIFIAGGAGYVGSRLVPQLVNEGHKVTVYDIMYFGSSKLFGAATIINPKQKDNVFLLIKEAQVTSDFAYLEQKNVMNNELN